MDTRIIIKKSEEVGKIPTSDQLTLGELALNTADGKLYAKKTNDTVTEIGAQPTSINYSLLTGTVPTWNQNTTGNAATATTATSATTATTAGTVTTAAQPAITSVGTLTGLTVTNPISGSITGNAATATNVPYTGLTGTVPTWNQNTTGNAATVTNGVYTTSTATVTNTMLSGSIENNKLTNSSVTINSGTGISGGATVSLGGSVTLTNSGVTSVNSNTGAITGIAVTSGTLGQFSATTSAQLAGLITDETGSGSLVFGTSPSISTLEISTTGGGNKIAAINMASGVTATNSVSSEIIFYSYNADASGTPPVPVAAQGSISSNIINGSDLKIKGSGDSFISFLNNSIIIGDGDGNVNGNCITLDVDAGVNEIIGVTNFYSTVTVADTVTIGTGLGLINSESRTLFSTLANQTLSQTVVSTVYRSVEFFVQASTAGGAYEALRIMVLHDGTNTYNTQYGVICSGTSLGTYTTTLAAIGGLSRIRLRVTPTTVNTTYKVMITALPV